MRTKRVHLIAAFLAAIVFAVPVLSASAATTPPPVVTLSPSVTITVLIDPNVTNELTLTGVARACGASTASFKATNNLWDVSFVTKWSLAIGSGTAVEFATGMGNGAQVDINNVVLPANTPDGATTVTFNLYNRNPLGQNPALLFGTATGQIPACDSGTTTTSSTSTSSTSTSTSTSSSTTSSTVTSTSSTSTTEAPTTTSTATPTTVTSTTTAPTTSSTAPNSSSTSSTSPSNPTTTVNNVTPTSASANKGNNVATPVVVSPAFTG